MGQRQPRVTADEIIKVLKSIGFEKIDQSGSHQKMEASINTKTNNHTLSFREIIRPKTFILKDSRGCRINRRGFH